MANIVTFIEKEFILSQVRRAGGKAVVFGSAKTARCSVKAFDKDQVTLEGGIAELEAFRPWEAVSVYLSYQGQRLTFSSKVRRVDGPRLFLAMPERLFKAPQRKSIRVPPPHGLKLEFFLQNERVRIDCPESQEYLDIELPEQREGFDTTSMNGLLDSFKRKAASRYSKNGVVMFSKSRFPQSIEERLVSKLGRCLLVTSTRSPLPADDPYPDGRIITQAMEENFEGPAIFLEGSELEKSRLQKADQGIVSEVYCPILYYQYVVGYIYLMNDTAKKVCLDYSAVDFAWEFGRILTYSLKSHGYYRADDQYKPTPHAPEVLDLSATGCLFVLPKAAYSVRLRKSSVLEMRIVAGPCSMELRGRVVRHFTDREGEYYGVAFLALDGQRMELLRTLLYAEASARSACDELELQE